MQFSMPEYVTKCLAALYDAGFLAYPVGGCVRDTLLGLEAHDYDITSNATPQQIKSVFSHTIDTGLRHGTVTVLIDHHPIEITQMRVDGDYTDHRRPDSVSPTDSIAMDLKRRDFTVNAMAVERDGSIIDLFEGYSDLNARIIRTVGDAQTRYREDALRILRAFRFSSTLDFDIEPQTLSAALQNAQLLQNISIERINSELQKLLCGKRPTSIEPLLKHRSLEFLGLRYEQPLEPIAALPCERVIRMSAFIYLCGGSGTADIICDNLKCDKRLRRAAVFYNELLCNPPALDARSLKSIILKSDYETVVGALQLLGQLRGISVQQAEQTLRKIRRDPIRLSELSINGNDLLKLGIRGRAISYVLDELLDIVHADPAANSREYLINAARTIFERMSEND